MNINKNNYEAFFLDYHEGNLSPQQVADLLLFIEQHPELREEFESFENLTLNDLTSVSFEDKSILKKEITIQNKEDYFIRSIENTLNPAEKNLLNDFIKQHPQFLTDLELFQKTKLAADPSIVFENKDSLKRNAVTTDDLLIASVEGLLTKGETILLTGQLAVDTEMNHNLSLYKQTKLVADITVVYENKEELKHKEKKIIPLFYYVSGIAAAIILLIGLFFLFNGNDKKEPQIAKKESGIKTQETVPDKINEVVENENNSAMLTDLTDSSAKKQIKNNTPENKISPSDKKDPVIIPLNEIPPVNIAENKNNDKQDPLQNNEQLPIANNSQKPLSNNEEVPAIASVQSKTETTKEYLSLRELAAVKIKEKTLNENTLTAQKKSGRAKRFTGWDVAQIITRGLSKVTGRDVELKPTYNDEGDITAYALGKGIEVSKGK